MTPLKSLLPLSSVLSRDGSCTGGKAGGAACLAYDCNVTGICSYRNEKEAIPGYDRGPFPSSKSLLPRTSPAPLILLIPCPSTVSSDPSHWSLPDPSDTFLVCFNPLFLLQNIPIPSQLLFYLFTHPQIHPNTAIAAIP